MSLNLAMFIIANFISIFEIRYPIEKSQTDCQDKKLLVAFYVGEKEIEIRDRFNFYLVNGTNSFKVAIKGNILRLPHLEKDTGYKVVFNYKKYKLSFDGLTKRMIFPGQDVIWRFGVDKRPFHESLAILSPKRYRELSTKVKRLEYLQFQLMEEGDGIQFVKASE